jgi:branched-chain amino acid transport system substrate-binding protein
MSVRTLARQLIGAGAAVLAITTTAQAQLPPNIKIALGMPLSGPLTLNGEEVRDGAQLAVDAINAKGGVKGRSKIELIVADTRCNPTNAVNATQRLISQGIDLFVGEYCSSASLAIMPVLAETGIPQITLSYAPSITGKARTANAVRIGPSAGLQMAPVAKYAVTVNGNKRFASLTTNDDFGRSMAEAFSAAVKKLGGEVVDFQYYQFGADFSTYLTKIKNLGVDGLLMVGLGNDTVSFTKSYFELGLTMNIYGGDNFSDVQYVQKQKPKPQNLYFPWLYDEGAARDKSVAPPPAYVKEFAAAFQAKYNKAPTRNNVWGYASVEVFRQAIEQIDSIDKKKLAAHLHSGAQFRTPFGDLKFAPCGQAENRNGIGKFEGDSMLFLRDKSWGDDVVPGLCPDV